MSELGRARRGSRAWLSVLVVVAWGAATLAQEATAASVPEITVVGNRADLVSGGDALVEITWPSGVDPATAKFFLNGRELTGVFAQRPNGRFMGLVEGMRLGPNDLAVTVPGGGAKLQITNHPAGGPVFAGE